MILVQFAGFWRIKDISFLGNSRVWTEAMSQIVDHSVGYDFTEIGGKLIEKLKDNNSESE